jgi:hypothetical protein
MKNKSVDINNIFLKILKEEINKKSQYMSEKVGEWVEIDTTNEELHGNQHKIDVAKPKGKITKADFDVLRKKRKNKKSVQERNSLKLTENELIDLIENIVKKQINESEDYNNIKIENPEGLRKTKKVQRTSKVENEEYAKEVVKKMNEYLKDGSKGKYEENPEFFPKGNGELSKMTRKGFTPSDDVEEYIENFAYPGLENLEYDGIKPNEEWVEKNIVGSSETGNNPKWANATNSKLGEKINKKRKNNNFGKEKEKSYNRVPQPFFNKKENIKSDKVNMTLESIKDETNNKIIREMEKIKNLFSYNEKTQ